MKLLAWLRLAGIPYEQAIEHDTGKGPKKKNPWVELDGEAIGDTEIIIDLLAKKHAVRLDRDLTPEQHALGHAWRRTFEEHFHQALEWELLVHDAGATYMRDYIRPYLPPVVGGVVFNIMRSQMRKQLHARGIARHAPDIIAAKGRADLDALAAFLADRPFLLIDRPTSYDAAVFGLLSPVMYWTMDTPVAQHARSITQLKSYCDRMKQRCFN